MRTHMMLAALALSFAACTTETTYEGSSLPGPTVAKTMCRTGCSGLESSIENRTWVPLDDGVYQRLQGAADALPDLCGQLPETGTCALACDAAAFGGTLPVGTCGAELCAVAGGELLVSACNTAN